MAQAASSIPAQGLQSHGHDVAPTPPLPSSPRCHPPWGLTKVTMEVVGWNDKLQTVCFFVLYIWCIYIYICMIVYVNKKRIYVYIYMLAPPPGPTFWDTKLFQRKVCIRDFVRWYSYISNELANCFQCNVWVSTICFTMAAKPSLCWIPLLNVSIIIDNVVGKCSLHWNILWISFYEFLFHKEYRIIKKTRKAYQKYLFWVLVFRLQNVGLRDLRFTKPAYTKKNNILMPKAHKTWLVTINTFDFFEYMQVLCAFGIKMFFWSICRFCAL